MSAVRYGNFLVWLRQGNGHPASHREKLTSAVGGFIGILLLFWISAHWLDPRAVTLVVASMGATAVLLFAVPHGSLSQPWPVFGGHLVSAAVGVTCARWLGDPVLAAALAVGLAIAAMYYLRCLHPPGGATALVAVIGGPQIHALGYGFLLEPVLLNAVVLVVTAVLVNAPFASRRYPHLLMPAPEATALSCPAGEKCVIAHSDLVYALSELDSYIDVSEEDLLQIYALAMRHAVAPAAPALPAAGLAAAKA